MCTSPIVFTRQYNCLPNVRKHAMHFHAKSMMVRYVYESSLSRCRSGARWCKGFADMMGESGCKHQGHSISSVLARPSSLPSIIDLLKQNDQLRKRVASELPSVPSICDKMPCQRKQVQQTTVIVCDASLQLTASVWHCASMLFPFALWSDFPVRQDCLYLPVYPSVNIFVCLCFCRCIVCSVLSVVSQ